VNAVYIMLWDKVCLFQDTLLEVSSVVDDFAARANAVNEREDLCAIDEQGEEEEESKIR